MDGPQMHTRLFAVYLGTTATMQHPLNYLDGLERGFNSRISQFVCKI